MFSKFKIPLIGAGAVLVLSIIIGILNGVRFSSILIRSVILSLLAGGFVFAAKEILERFVPELFQPPIPKDIPHNKEAGEKVNISIDDPIDMAPVSGDENIPADVQATNAEMGGESGTARSEYAAADHFTENTDETDETGENTETASTEHAPQVNSPAAVNSPELEELPDLQDIAPLDEEEIEGTAQKQSFAEESAGRFNISTDLNGSDVDASTMVQAIRTVLKRES